MRNKCILSVGHFFNTSCLIKILACLGFISVVWKDLSHATHYMLRDQSVKALTAQVLYIGKAMFLHYYIYLLSFIFPIEVLIISVSVPTLGVH